MTSLDQLITSFAAAKNILEQT